MKKFLTKKLLLRLSFCIFGIMLISLSGSLFYLLNMGSDPYQVFAVAVHRALSISYGAANIMLNGIIILFFLIFKRNYIKISLFLCLIISGPFLDFFNWLLGSVINQTLPFFVKLSLVILGCINLAFGVYIYITPAMGASPADSVGLLLSELLNKPYKYTRIITDVSFTAIGFFLGGTVGIATVLGVLLTGPFIGIFHRLLDKNRFIVKAMPPEALNSVIKP